MAASVFSAMSRGDLLVIGEARPEEVRVARTRRSDFLRWFETYDVREPALETTRAIAQATAQRLEQEPCVLQLAHGRAGPGAAEHRHGDLREVDDLGAALGWVMSGGRRGGIAAQANF